MLKKLIIRCPCSLALPRKVLARKARNPNQRPLPLRPLQFRGCRFQ